MNSSQHTPILYVGSEADIHKIVEILKSRPYQPANQPVVFATELPMLIVAEFGVNIGSYEEAIEEEVPLKSQEQISVQLSNILQTKITDHPSQLISRILSHFITKDRMTEYDFEQLRGVYTSKFRGNRGVVYNLQNNPHAWLSRYQQKYGSIIEECNEYIHIIPVWKKALHRDVVEW
jgi:hypothetical protein